MNYDSIIDKYKNNAIEYYEVLTDGNFYWIHVDTLVKICKEISSIRIANFNFKMDSDVVFGEDYVCVEESFLKFVKENTFTPKYCARLALLRTRVREYDPQNNLEKNTAITKLLRTDETIDYALEYDDMQKSR